MINHSKINISFNIAFAHSISVNQSTPTYVRKILCTLSLFPDVQHLAHPHLAHAKIPTGDRRQHAGPRAGIVQGKKGMLLLSRGMSSIATPKQMVLLNSAVRRSHEAGKNKHACLQRSGKPFLRQGLFLFRLGWVLVFWSMQGRSVLSLSRTSLSRIPRYVEKKDFFPWNMNP